MVKFDWLGFKLHIPQVFNVLYEEICTWNVNKLIRPKTYQFHCPSIFLLLTWFTFNQSSYVIDAREYEKLISFRILYWCVGVSLCCYFIFPFIPHPVPLLSFNFPYSWLNRKNPCNLIASWYSINIFEEGKIQKQRFFFNLFILNEY